MTDDPWKIEIIGELWKRDNANKAKAHKDKKEKVFVYLPDAGKLCTKEGKPIDRNFKWRAERDYNGEINSLHLLTCCKCFGDFVNEYSVGRGIEAKGQGALREYLLVGNLERAMKDHDGQGLEALALELNDKDFTKNVCRSLVSKVAALANPREFVPYDSFARDGIGKLREDINSSFVDFNKNPIPKKRDTIDAFYKNVNVVIGCTKAEVQKYYDAMEQEKPTFETFHRRIVDLYLMAKGGRWRDERTPFDKDFIWPDKGFYD